MQQEITDAIQHLKNAAAKEESNKKQARAEVVQAVNILHVLLGLAAVGPDIDPARPPANSEA